MELLDLYLGRSGKCLLNIRFERIIAEGGDPDPEFERNNFDRHLNSLIPQAMRWRQFSIHALFNRVCADFDLALNFELAASNVERES